MRLWSFILLTLLVSCSTWNLNRGPASLTEASCSAFKARFPKYPDNTEFQKRILALEKKLTVNQQAQAQILSNMTNVEKTLVELKQQRKFWDYFMWGLFGEVKLLKKIKDGQFHSMSLKDQLAEIERALFDLDKEIKKAVEEYLLNVDDLFKQFHRLKTQYESLICSGRNCRKQIKAAKRSLGDSNTDTKIDLLNDSKNMAVLSTLNKPQSNKAVKKAVASAEAFKEELEDFTRTIEGITIRKEEEELDQIVELVTEKSYDFLSIQTVLKLSEMDKDMTRLNEEITVIIKSLNKEYEKMDEIIEDYVCLTRKICLSQK